MIHRKTVFKSGSIHFHSAFIMINHRELKEPGAAEPQAELNLPQMDTDCHGFLETAKHIKYTKNKTTTEPLKGTEKNRTAVRGSQRPEIIVILSRPVSWGRRPPKG